MMYRALWKSTIYTCEDYGALCRCLFWVGAESFVLTEPWVDSCFRENLLSPNSVLVEKVECYEEN